MAPRTAQAAMQHSSLDLTMLARRGENVYTDPSLLDVAGAFEDCRGGPREAEVRYCFVVDSVLCCSCAFQSRLEVP